MSQLQYVADCENLNQEQVALCMLFRQYAGSRNLIPGSLLAINGQLRYYEGRISVTVRNIEEPSDPNVELLFWIDTTILKADIYSRPPTLPPDIDSIAKTALSGSRVEPGDNSDCRIRKPITVPRNLSSSDIIANALLSRIEESVRQKGQMSWTDIVADRELQAGVNLIGKDSEYKVKIQSALSHLRGAGKIYCIDETCQADENFAVLHDEIVRSRIRSILSQARDEFLATMTSELFRGLRTKVLIDRVSTSFHGSNLAEDRVQNQLDELVHKGYLYVSNSFYQLVDSGDT